jgi:hypothetical protein
MVLSVKKFVVNLLVKAGEALVKSVQLKVRYFIF